MWCGVEYVTRRGRDETASAGAATGLPRDLVTADSTRLVYLAFVYLSAPHLSVSFKHFDAGHPSPSAKVKERG